MRETLREVTGFIVGACLCAVAGYSVALSLERGWINGKCGQEEMESEAIFEISRHSGEPTIITWIKRRN